jgi:TRAP-type C4-dicarboxylate transport system permease small subunit
MALTCADVAGRYFLNAPLPGAFEITELAMGALIFTGLPLVTLRRQQVTVDLLDRLVPLRLRSFRDALMHALGAICTGVVAWRLWVKAGQMLSSGDTTSTLQAPVAPLVYYMSVQAAITALILLFLVLHRGGPERRPG